jgi:hypothetical protein
MVSYNSIYFYCSVFIAQFLLLSFYCSVFIAQFLLLSFYRSALVISYNSIYFYCSVFIAQLWSSVTIVSTFIAQFLLLSFFAQFLLLSFSHQLQLYLLSFLFFPIFFRVFLSLIGVLLEVYWRFIGERKYQCKIYILILFLMLKVIRENWP